MSAAEELCRSRHPLHFIQMPGACVACREEVGEFGRDSDARRPWLMDGGGEEA